MAGLDASGHGALGCSGGFCSCVLTGGTTTGVMTFVHVFVHVFVNVVEACGGELGGTAGAEGVQGTTSIIVVVVNEALHG